MQQLGRLYATHYTWDYSKPTVQIILKKVNTPAHQEELNHKLRAILSKKGFGGIIYNHLDPMMPHSRARTGKLTILKNLEVIEQTAKACKASIICWGNAIDEGPWGNAITILYLINKAKTEILSFGLNRYGHPRYPLYLSLRAVLYEFDIYVV